MKKAAKERSLSLRVSKDLTFFRDCSMTARSVFSLSFQALLQKSKTLGHSQGPRKNSEASTFYEHFLRYRMAAVLSYYCL